MPFRLPDPIAYLFEGFTIQPEDIALDPEDSRPVGKGRVVARALDGFLFVKGGKFVYPTYGLPQDWWRGVVVYGYTAALTGEFKYFIWSGHWDQDYEGKHMEVVIISNLQGLSKETDKNWRNGEDCILWLDSDQGYSYALLEPAEEYDRGNWTRVTASWKDAPSGNSPGDPAFVKTQAENGRPEWWDSEGDDAWEYLVGSQPCRPQLLTQGALLAGKGKEGNMHSQVTEHILIESGSSDGESPASSPPVRHTRSCKSTKGKTVNNYQTKLNASLPRGKACTSSKRSPMEHFRETKVKPTIANKSAREPLGVSGNRQHLKRRVVSGQSNHRLSQKQKISKPIYVDSDSSEEEGAAPTSSSPRLSLPNLNGEAPLERPQSSIQESAAPNPDRVQRDGLCERQISIANKAETEIQLILADKKEDEAGNQRAEREIIP